MNILKKTVLAVISVLPAGLYHGEMGAELDMHVNFSDEFSAADQEPLVSLRNIAVSNDINLVLPDHADASYPT